MAATFSPAKEKAMQKRGSGKARSRFLAAVRKNNLVELSGSD
jgi:hypothetical protein